MYPRTRPQVGATAIELGASGPSFGGSRYMQSSNAGYGGPYYSAAPYVPVRTTEEAPPVLVRGSTGRWVVYVQQRLGFQPPMVTGVYDVRTEAAVRDLQRSAGLAPTGVTDIPTWGAILGGNGAPYGFGQLATPYGSYDPYFGGYGGGYPYNYALLFSGRSGGRSPTSGGQGR